MLSEEELLHVHQGGAFNRYLGSKTPLVPASEIERAEGLEAVHLACDCDDIPHPQDLQKLLSKAKHLSVSRFYSDHILEIMNVYFLDVPRELESAAIDQWHKTLVQAFCLGKPAQVETLRLGSLVKAEHLLELFRTFKVLSLGVKSDAREHLIKALEDPNCVVRELELGVDWSDEEFIRVVTSTPSLWSLTIIPLRKKVPLGEALTKAMLHPRCTIRDLALVNVEDISLTDVAALIEHPACGLRSVRFLTAIPGEREAFFRAVQRSKLQHLGLRDEEPTRTLRESNIESLRCWDMDGIPQILSGSKLRHLTIMRPTYLNERMLVDFLDRGNCHLETLTLELYAWKSKQLESRCSEILKRNTLWRQGGLLDEGLTTPSTAKLFICGDSGVGKTTIRKNLNRKFRVPRFLQSSQSTHGIKLQPLIFGHDEKKLMVCDLAGQPEYHAFHHYFIRGSDKDLFLLVCKAPRHSDDHTTLEDQLRYWLRFIVAHRSSVSEQGSRPRVLILLNYFPSSQQPHNSMRSSRKQLAFIRCRTVIQEYSAHIDFGESAEHSVYGMDARSVREVSELKGELDSVLNNLLERRPKIPVVCERLIRSLDASLPRPKLLSLESFKIKYGMGHFDEALFKACVMHLHDMVELVFFAHEESSAQQQVIILDVQWFLQEVIGDFLPRFDRSNFSRAVAVQQVANVHASLSTHCEMEYASGILLSLQNMGVILLDNDSAPRSVTILPLLAKGSQGWEEETSRSDATSYSFWGRRLDCKDSARNLLPYAIFNMLQVKLAKMFSQHRVDQGWLYLVENRVHIIVSIGGTRGEWYDLHWIDVLMRVPQNILLEEAERLFQQVLSCVTDMCGALHWRCPTLELEEKVIRPSDVKNNPGSISEEVHPLADLLETVKERCTLVYEHSWPSLQSTPILELLLPSERDAYINDKHHELKVLEYEVLMLDCVQTREYEDVGSASEEGGNENSVMIMLRELKLEIMKQLKALETRITESETKITGEIQKLELCLREHMSELQIRGAQIMSKLVLHFEFESPKYPYLTDENNVLQKISQSAFGSTLRLHFLCEYQRCCHPVENQKGMQVPIAPWWLKKAAPVMIPAIRVMFFALKVVAIAGLGVALPTPSSEFPKGLRDASIQAVVEKLFDNVDKSFKSLVPSKMELQEFYKELDRMLKGKDMEKEFGLFRKVQNGRSSWLCKEHYNI